MRGKDHVIVLRRTDHVIEERWFAVRAFIHQPAAPGGRVDPVVRGIAENNGDRLFFFDRAGFLSLFSEDECISEQAWTHRGVGIFERIGEIHPHIVDLHKMALRFGESLTDTQLRHSVRAGQQFEGEHVFRQVLGHLLRSGRPAFSERCFGCSVDDRQGIGAGPGGRV